MGKMEDEGYLLTGLDVFITEEINGALVEKEMDVYCKTFIIDGIPITGYFVVPMEDTLLDIEPIEVDMINNFIWTYKVDKVYVRDNGLFVQKFKYTIYRNNKEFCSNTYNDLTTTERNLHAVLERLHTKRNRVDFRMKDFRERLVGNTFMVSNLTFEVLEYIDGENKIKVRSTKDNTETILDAFIVNE